MSVLISYLLFFLLVFLHIIEKTHNNEPLG